MELSTWSWRYLSGKTLKQVIRDEGPLSLARTVEIMRQVGDALAAAHAQNVVHRDLKSDNIMLVSTRLATMRRYSILGLQKLNEPEGDVDSGLTAPNLVIGTPQYMSPEQCSQDREIDARSDIYSFGVILYEMLVGHVPFTGDSPTIVMMKHLQDPVPSVLEERTDLPPASGVWSHAQWPSFLTIAIRLFMNYRGLNDSRRE
jgi:serine/threonine-protein kinase